MKKKAREIQNDLDFQIQFIENVLHKTPTFIEALVALGELYTKRGLYEKGLEADRRLSAIASHTTGFNPKISGHSTRWRNSASITTRALRRRAANSAKSRSAAISTSTNRTAGCSTNCRSQRAVFWE